MQSLGCADMGNCMNGRVSRNSYMLASSHHTGTISVTELSLVPAWTSMSEYLPSPFAVDIHHTYRAVSSQNQLLLV